MKIKFPPYILITILILILSIIQCFLFVNFNYSFNEKFIYTLCTFAFYMLINSVSKKLFNIFFIISYLCIIFIFSSLKIYGSIDINYIKAIYYTNAAEAISYTKLLNHNVYIPLILLAIYGYFLIKKNKKILLSKISKIILLTILLLVSVTKYFVSNPKEISSEKFIYISPINKIVEISKILLTVNKESNFLKEASRLKDSWEITAKPLELPFKNIVIILGESVRKDFLHSYGFPIKNTPFIDSSKNIQFNNYISVGSHTLPSLMRTICESKNILNFNIRNTLITLSNRIGYKTHWISNQGIVGRYDSPTSIIASKADSITFLRSSKINTKTPSDTMMLPYLHQILNKNTSVSNMTILHMIGSHPISCDITGGKYDEYIKSDEISCYIKTIRDTDNFLSNIHTALTQTGESFFMLYLSDHGLKITNENILRHSDETRNAFDVPLILWSNQINKSIKIDATRTGSDFLHLICEILNIKTLNITKSYKFISEENNEETQTRVITGGIKKPKIVLYNELEYNPSSIIFTTK